MNDFGVVDCEMERHAIQLAKSLANIFSSCGFSPKEIVSIMGRATDGLRSRSVAASMGGSISDHLACTDVVYLWRQDPRFLDERGEPRQLGRGGAIGSFDDLVCSAAPGFEAGHILKYLIGSGAVVTRPDGCCALMMDSVLACSGTEGGKVAAEVILMHLMGFFGSVEYNIGMKTNNEAGKFERACYSYIPANLAPVFEKLVESRGQNFVDSVDEWLVRHRIEDSESSVPALLAGAGAYVIVRPGSKAAIGT